MCVCATEIDNGNENNSICLEAAPVNNALFRPFVATVCISIQYETWANSKFIFSIGEFHYLHGFSVEAMAYRSKKFSIFMA